MNTPGPLQSATSTGALQVTVVFDIIPTILTTIIVVHMTVLTTHSPQAQIPV